MNTKYNDTKSLVEAGLLATLIVVIMLFNIYIPAFSTIGTFFLPIPVTVLYIRHNYKLTILSVVVSAIIIAMLYNPISALISAVSYGLIGAAMGYCIRNEVKISITLFWITVASLVSMVLNIVIRLNLVLNQSLIQVIEESLQLFRDASNQAMQLFTQMGLDSQQITASTKYLEAFTPEIMILILPGLLVASSFFVALMNYLVTKAILKKLRYNTKDITPFQNWYVDNRLIAIIISFMLLGMMFTSRNMVIGNYITASLFVLLILIGTLDGMAVAIYYLKKRFNMKRITLVLVISIIFIMGVNAMFLYLGIADVIFDFRKLDPNRIFRKRAK